MLYILQIVNQMLFNAIFVGHPCFSGSFVGDTMRRRKRIRKKRKRKNTNLPEQQTTLSLNNIFNNNKSTTPTYSHIV